MGIAVQPRGKILLGISGRALLADGWTFEQKRSSTDFELFSHPVSTRVAQLRADGARDPGFEEITLAGVHPVDQRFAVFLAQPDGKVLLEGMPISRASSTGGFWASLTRLNPNGTVDESFRPLFDGRSLSAAAVRFDGTIAIAGGFRLVNGVDRLGLAQLNPDGSLDRRFASNYSGYNIDALAFQADGKLLVADWDGSVVRLSTTGVRDVTFNIGNPGFQGSILDLMVLPNGQIIVSGTFHSVHGRARSGLARLNGDLHLTNNVPRFARITRDSLGSARLAIEVIPGRRYTLQASTDLMNWTILNTVTATDYFQILYDYPAGSYPRRFYRLQRLAP